MIPLSVFLYIFYAALAIFILYSLFNLYHLLRFGFLSVANMMVVLIYIIITGIFFYVSYIVLSGIDWSQPLVQFGAFFSNNIPIGL